MENGFRNLFSVVSRKNPTQARVRSVVTYIGIDSGAGLWECSKDGQAQRCDHINQAQQYLKELGTESDSVEQPFIIGKLGILLSYFNLKSITEGQMDFTSLKCGAPVSYLPISIPKWARISADEELYPDIPPVALVENLIHLTPLSKCQCNQFYDPAQAVYTKKCTVYTLTKLFHTTIELQTCSKCQSIQSRPIGPDCRELGIFNLNNHSLFTHDLLEEYTTAYTSSETPFTAWVHMVSIRYGRYTPGGRFVDEKVFRNAWFGYASLLSLDRDFQCLQCGNTPETIIWDGVTISFNKKQLQNDLYPPTTVHSQSIQRDATYIRNQAFILSNECRKIMASIFSGPLTLDQLSLSLENVGEDEDFSDSEIQDKRKKVQDILYRVKQIPSLESLLQDHYPALFPFFQKYCSSAVLLVAKKCPQEVINFFQQVSIH